jgi:hypothetical protein
VDKGGIAKRLRNDLLCKVVLCAVAVLMTASSAHAIDKCKVKVDKRTGVILVAATGVAGPLAWGEASGQEVNSFFNSGTCVVADKAKGCQLGDPNTLASKTAPAGCTLYLDDGATPCSSWIPGCSPGARRDTGAVINDANGTLIGVALDPAGQTAVRDDGGTLVRLAIQYDGSGFYAAGGLLYASSNCTGTALSGMDASMVKYATIFGTTAYYSPATVVNQSVASFLNIGPGVYVDQATCDLYFGLGNSTFVAPYGCCVAAGPTASVNPAQTIDLSGFVPPFKVELP